MTKQLVAKPIIIESPQHFDFIKSNYNRNQQVIITCENCGSTKIRKYLKYVKEKYGKDFLKNLKVKN